MYTKENHQPQPYDKFDRVLRDEMRWQAPPDLTMQLMQLAQDPTLIASVRSSYQDTQDTQDDGAIFPQQVYYGQPGRWYSALVMVLTCIAVGLSTAAAWHVYGVVGAELGANTLWQQGQIAFASGLQQLYAEMPVTRSLVSELGTLHEQALLLFNWLLVAFILWLSLDLPASALSQQQVS